MQFHNGCCLNLNHLQNTLQDVRNTFCNTEPAQLKPLVPSCWFPSYMHLACYPPSELSVSKNHFLNKNQTDVCEFWKFLFFCPLFPFSCSSNATALQWKPYVMIPKALVHHKTFPTKVAKTYHSQSTVSCPLKITNKSQLALWKLPKTILDAAPTKCQKYTAVFL